MTPADLRLLRQVFRQARRQAWYNAPHQAYRVRGDRLMCVDVLLPDREMLGCLRIGRRPGPDQPWTMGVWHHPETVRDAVDWLASEGVLPAPFSSLYRRGYSEGCRASGRAVVAAHVDDGSEGALVAATLLALAVVA